jgi:hypothetical protein
MRKPDCRWEKDSPQRTRRAQRGVEPAIETIQGQGIRCPCMVNINPIGVRACSIQLAVLSGSGLVSLILPVAI